MKTKILLTGIIVALSSAGFCTTKIITNSGFTFSPETVTINMGDTISFEVTSTHNGLEVSESTWNANGNTPLSGGFITPFGGGLVLPDKLTVGTHYYVCQNHYSMGMKGKIIVQNSNGIDENRPEQSFSVYPNPASKFITIVTKKNLPEHQFYIINPEGKEVLAGKLTAETKTIDIEQLSPGIYFIRFDGQRETAIKFTKE
jgi:plastocyanin